MSVRESVAFLLGAGFSAPLGVPTMRPFFRDFIAFSRRRYPDLQATLDELLAKLNDEPDLEALLEILNSAVEVEAAALPPGFDMAPLQDWISDSKAIRAHLLADIVERCEQFDRTKARELCGPFFKNLSDGAIVFTTNYDRVPEYVCESLEVTWTDGFEAHKVVSPWQGSFDESLAIAKRHGSVTWYTDTSGPTEHLRLDRGYPLPGPDFRLSREGRDLDPLMIIPTLEKQTLAPPYNQLQNLFADTLSKVRLLVVLGSSLRDDHLVGAIEYRRESLTVLVVGRQSQQSTDRLSGVATFSIEADCDAFLKFSAQQFDVLRRHVADLTDKTEIETAVDNFASQEQNRLANVIGLPGEIQVALQAMREGGPAELLSAIQRVRDSSHPAVISSLVAVLTKSNDPDVKSAVAGCLGSVGASDAESVSALRSAVLSDPSPAVRLESALALNAIATPDAIAVLEERRTARPDDSFIDAVLGA